MDNAKLRNEERFKTNELRVENAVEVRAEITAWTSLFNKKELAEKLGGRVPFGPVNNIADIFDDPHVGARDMLRTVSVPDSKVEITMSGVPVHYSNTPGSVRTAGPRLDEHRDEVLQQFLVQS
jgi:formyl-CoA transferase